MKYLFLVIFLIMAMGCYRHSQTHGEGPYLENTVVDKIQYGHFYALFGIIDVTGDKTIDWFVKRHPNCRVITEQSPIDWFVGLLVARLMDSRTVTIEIPVDVNTNRGRELLEIQRKRQQRIDEEKLRQEKERGR